MEIPTLCDDFPWTYYELLKFFSETLSWPEDVEALVASSKSVFEILSTLSVCKQCYSYDCLTKFIVIFYINLRLH